MPSVVSEAVIWAGVPQVGYQWFLPLVFVDGLLSLPIYSVMRQSLSVLLEVEQLRPGFALDLVVNELVCMVGPVVGGRRRRILGCNRVR